MKSPRITAACAVLAAALMGCDSTEKVDEKDREINTWLLKSLQAQSVENAILSQRTLYAYHFAPGAAELNDLGEADLALLAVHYRKSPGTLTLRRGSAADELYGARQKAVLASLERAGVDIARMAVDDGLPGGDGADSSRVIAIMAVDKESLAASGEGSESESGVATTTSSAE
jgi:hypothetical protein